jgi:hypothetical protein
VTYPTPDELDKCALKVHVGFRFLPLIFTVTSSVRFCLAFAARFGLARSRSPLLARFGPRSRCCCLASGHTPLLSPLLPRFGLHALARLYLLASGHHALALACTDSRWALLSPFATLGPALSLLQYRLASAVTHSHSPSLACFCPHALTLAFLACFGPRARLCCLALSLTPCAHAYRPASGLTLHCLPLLTCFGPRSRLLPHFGPRALLFGSHQLSRPRTRLC